MLASEGVRRLRAEALRERRARVRATAEYRAKAVIGVVAILAFLFGFAGREIRLIALKMEERRLEEEIQAYKARNELLKEQLRVLQSDEYIEKVAREQLGWTKPGEIQYVLPSKQ